MAGGSLDRTPLRRNRDFVLLESGRLLSSTGTQLTTIAYPLLALALTHSPAKAGLVSFARIVPAALFSLGAGVAADRFDRRRLMLVADALRALAIATLVATIVAHRASFWPIPLVAFVEGTGSVLFLAAAAGALRSIVPRAQLPAAVATQGARTSIVRLVGPPVGGALFAVARAFPFVVDAASYGFSILSLLAMKTPFQEAREVDSSPLRAQLAEGFRFLWDQPFIRTTSFIYGIGNFALPGVLFVVVVAGREHGLSGGAIGVLLAAFAACTLLGSLLSPFLRRALSVRAILLLELWAWAGTIAFLVRPNVYVLTASVLPLAVTLPVTDSVVVGYRIAVTPDRILGRVESVRTNIAFLLGSLGPLVPGLLLESRSARETVALFTACGLGLAVWGTLSPTIRNAPSLAELDAAQKPEGPVAPSNVS